MAKQRYLNTKFWTDTYITGLDPIEKLLFLYFITNHLTNISGVYEIQLKQVAFDTGIHIDMVEKIMARFERDKKMVYRSGWVCAVNFVKHQNLNSDCVRAGIVRELKGAPPELVRYIDGIGTILNLDLTFTELEPLPEPLPNEKTKPPQKQAKSSTSLTEAQKEVRKVLLETWQEHYKKRFPIAYKDTAADWKQLKDRNIFSMNPAYLVRLVEVWFMDHGADAKYFPPHLHSFATGWERAETLAKSTKSSKDVFNKVSGWEGK